MRKIDLNLIYEESFVDNLIKQSKIDLVNKKISLITNGGYLNTNQILSKCEIFINNWQKLEIICKKGNDLENILEPPNEFLSSIIEFHNDSNQLSLIGLGKDCWIEWRFSKPKIEIYGDIDQN